MDNQPSFIPKKQLTATFRGNETRSRVSLFFLISIILFVVSLILAAGVFFLQKYKTNTIQTKVASLERARGLFEPDLIRELIDVDVRIKSANEVINNHISASSFFKLLEQVTIKTIRFKDLELSAGENNTYSITMNGEADSYASVALQSSLFGGNKYILEPIFSDFELTEKGNVLFNFSAKIDRALLLYENSLAK